MQLGQRKEAFIPSLLFDFTLVLGYDEEDVQYIRKPFIRREFTAITEMGFCSNHGKEACHLQKRQLEYADGGSARSRACAKRNIRSMGRRLSHLP